MNLKYREVEQVTERLINKGTNDELWVSDTDYTRSKGKIPAVMEKLYKYETAEEDGRLMILPCKLGDVVYEIHSRYTYCTPYRERFDESSCCGCEEECDSHKEYEIIEIKMHVLESIAYHIRLGNFGKTVFLTREEAEDALEEMKK